MPCPIQQDQLLNPSLKNLLLHHDDAVTFMDQHSIGQEEIILSPTIKNNSSLLLELKTCHWDKLSLITTQMHVNLQDLSNYNRYPGNLPQSISMIVSIPSEVLNPLHNEPNHGPSFQHEKVRPDQTSFHTLLQHLFPA